MYMQILELPVTHHYKPYFVERIWPDRFIIAAHGQLTWKQVSPFCLLEIFQSLHQYIKHMFYIDRDFEISHTINWLWAGMISPSVQILEPNPQWCPKVWVWGKSIQIQVKPDESVTLNAKHVICKIHSEPLTLDILINSGRVYVWFNSLYKINKIFTCA